MKALASDNQGIDDIQVLLRSVTGEEISISSTLGRNDRIEEVKVPNPGSFGAVIVEERFVSDFSGRMGAARKFCPNMGQNSSCMFGYRMGTVILRIRPQLNLNPYR